MIGIRSPKLAAHRGEGEEFKRCAVKHAVCKAFEGGERKVELSDLDLTTIPDDVVDLSHYRTCTPDGTITCDIELFLASNRLQNVAALFRIPNLTVLSLRKNELENLPASIRELVNLRELNIANNNLRALPAEVAQLPNLQTLVCHPNVNFAKEDQLGPLKAPSLHELALRKIAVSKINVPRMGATMALYCNTQGIRCAGCQMPVFTEYIEDIFIMSACNSHNVPLAYRSCSPECAIKVRAKVKAERASSAPDQRAEGV